MNKKLQRKIALAAMQGNEAPATEIFDAGIRSMKGAISICKYPLQQAAPKSGAGLAVRCKLRYGTRIAFWLYPRSCKPHPKSRYTFMTLTSKNGTQYDYSDPTLAARALAKACSNHEQVIGRACDAIERARKFCFAIAEEYTRWQ